MTSQADRTRKWFGALTWLQGWDVLPDRSIDMAGFSSAYQKTPDLWNSAFRFLADTDLKNISAGVYKLDADNLLVNVQEYISSDEADTQYEAHRKYADIQYIISGIEKIGIVHLNNTIEVTPYDELNDIVFLRTEINAYHLAKQDRFFIFLPDNAHRPCVKNDFPALVKKVVIKVRIV